MTDRPTVRFLDRTTPPHIVTLVLLAGVSALNMSIFLPSLNQMAQDFDTTYATMQFAISGYLAATAALQLFVGPISDRYGRRQVTLWALALFVVATLGALMAPTITVFLLFRMMQAVVATGLVLSRAVVRDMVPQDQAASMIGYVTMGMALVPMIGPAIGGALDQAFDWHATLVFLALAGTAVWTICYFDQGETLQSTGLSFPEQMRNYPELLASPRFWGYAACAAFASGAFFAFLGGAPYVADHIYGLSPTMTGAALGVPAIGYALGNFLSGRYSVQYGINRLTLIGSIVTIAGLGASLLVSLLGFNSAGLFFGFCTLMGLGNGLVMPNATAGLLSVRPHLAGTASGLGGALMIAGGAVLSQVAGFLLGESTLPLQTLMLSCSILGLVAIFGVLRREARLALNA